MKFGALGRDEFHNRLPIQILIFKLVRLQEPFTSQKYKGIFDAWMKGTGPAHLFIYYQKPYKVTD